MRNLKIITFVVVSFWITGCTPYNPETNISSKLEDTLDTTAPNVAITSPAAGATVGNLSLTIQGTCENGLTVSISGTGLTGSSTTSCNGNYSTIVTLTAGNGSKSFSVSQTDAAGNPTTVSRQITYTAPVNPPPDTTAPILTITSPAAAATLTQTAFTVQGACETGLSVVISGTGITAGTSVSCTNSAYSANLNLTSGNGSKSFSVAQTDAASNNTTVTRQVTLNITTPPPTPSGQDLPGITMTLSAPSGNQRAVSSASQLSSALNNAAPGDVITVAPGTYNFSSKLYAQKNGTATQPIYLRAATPGTVHLISTSPEFFYVTGSYYIFENLKLSGSCSNDTDCDNIFHVIGNSYGHIIRNNEIFDYNAPFKFNADLIGDANRKYPHDVVIEHNKIYHTRPRVTGNPTNGVNLDGGIRFTVRANVIHDIANSTITSYSGFMKANSKDGIFERNVVICSKKHTGGSRIGLSFGGGGAISNPDICDFYPRVNGNLAEHTDGIVRNNIVMNCDDVGFYNNNGNNTRIINNIFYNTAGIQSRFVAASLTATNNVIQGTITNREGGTSVDQNNLKTASTAGFNSWYSNAGTGLFTLIGGVSNPVLGTATASPLVTNDICGVARTGALDLGPFNSSSNANCATSIKNVIDGI